MNFYIAFDRATPGISGVIIFCSVDIRPTGNVPVVSLVAIIRCCRKYDIAAVLLDMIAGVQHLTVLLCRYMDVSVTAKGYLKFANGAIGVIDNSRKAVYGYDQRVEVFGSEGCAEDQNDTPNTAVLSTADGAVHGVAYKVMWDRYTGAFVAEMQAFADAVINDKETPVTGEDGLYPVLMAAAATKSLHEGRPVKISEIEA